MPTPTCSRREAFIYYLISRMYVLKNIRSGQGFSRKFILKVLYKLSRKYPKGHFVRDNLPFFWHFYGTDCLAVESCVHDAKFYTWLQPVCGYKYLGKTDCYPNFDTNLDEDIKISIDNNLIEIMKPIDLNDPASIQSFYDDIYENEAPNEFTKCFGLYVKNAIGVDSKDEEYDDFVENVISQDVNNLRSLVKQCGRLIPKDPLFQDYRIIYDSYETIVDRALTHIEKHGKDEKQIFKNIIKELTVFMWNGFVYGNMTLEECHDEGCNEHITEWLNKYYDNLETLDSYVDVTYDRVFDLVKDDLDYDYPDEMSKKIISSMVEGYLTNQ